MTHVRYKLHNNYDSANIFFVKKKGSKLFRETERFKIQIARNIAKINGKWYFNREVRKGNNF